MNKPQLIADLIRLQNEMERMTTSGADNNQLKVTWANRMADVIEKYVKSGKVITEVTTVGEPVLPVQVAVPAGTGTTLKPDTTKGNGQGRIV